MASKKFNPFRPGAPVPPGIFAGRFKELEQIQKCIYQTINDRPQNLLIFGERGIGKTSIALCSKWISEGELETFENEKLNLFTIMISVNTRMNFEEVLTNIILQAQRKIGETQLLGVFKKIWSHLEEIKFGPVAFKKAIENKEISLASDEFCYFLEGLWDIIKDQYSGVVIIIDEFDRLLDFSGIASFLKTLLERLGADSYSRFMFLISGMGDLKEKLYKDHASVLRNFEPVELKTMPDNEAEQVINKALQETTVKITKEGLDLIISLAEGYPHFLQEIGYSAFEVDIDNEIGEEDVRDGVLGTEFYPGSIKRLGDQYFYRMFQLDIQSDIYREILSIIAIEDAQFVSRQTILSKFSKKKTVLGSYLKNLVERQILIKDKTRFGFYALPSKMFKIYIRMNSKLS